MDIIISIPEETKATRIEAYCKVYPNTETEPNLLHNPDKPELEPIEIPLFTDEEWVKEHIRRYVQDRCERGEKAIYTDNYEKAEIADITIEVK